MSEDQIIGLLFVIFITGTGSILFKLYIFNKFKCRKVLDSLKSKGFYQIDLQKQDIINNLNKYKLAQGEEHSTDNFQYILLQEKDTSHKRYLCDVYRKISNHKGGYQHKYYNVLIEALSLPINFDIIIRPKLSPLIESMMQIHKKTNSEDIVEITKGLTDDFKVRFAVVSISGNEVNLSDDFQDALLESLKYFPFNKISGAVTPVIKISPSGFCIIANRIMQKKDLDSILGLAETLAKLILKS